MLSAIWHSIVVFFTCSIIFKNDVIQQNGQTAGLWVFGTIASTLAILVVNLRIALETRYFI
jgi:hypothetical protein